MDIFRKESRRLEAEIDNKLLLFSKAVTVVNSLESAKQASLLEAQLKDALNQLESCLVQYKPASDSLTKTSFDHMIKRHQDILFEYNSTFKNLQSSLQKAKGQYELLESVEKSRNYQPSALQDAYVSERSRLDQQHEMTDALIEQAYETRSELNKQKSVLGNASNRLTNLAVKIPLVNSLIRRISLRKQRDAFIMACVIAFCICMLIYLR